MIGADDHTNNVYEQARRVLKALREGPKSTIQLRRDFDVMMPAARVHHLRLKGHEIVTLRTTETTECGKPHRVAKYVLIASATDANN